MSPLVDTNVVSELARPRPSAAVLAWFEAQRGFALSVVTVEELAYGIVRAPAARRTKLVPWFEMLLATSELLDITPAIARTAGELRAERARRGKPVTSADMLIAATAHTRGLTVVTRNVVDFEGVGVGVLDPFVA